MSKQIWGIPVGTPMSPQKIAEKTGTEAHMEDETIHVKPEEKQAWNNKSNFSGKYSDLSGKPTIPSKTSQLTNDSGFLTQHQSLSGYAKTADHYTKTESDNKYQAKGNYLTAVPSEYVTETELTAKGYAKQTAVDTLSGQIADQQAEIVGQDLTIENLDNKIANLQKTVENMTSLKAEGNTVEEQLAWLAENGDTSKEYLLADGYYYKCVKTTTTGKLYTNQMPISIGTDKQVYNGTGWKGQYRLSASSGSEKSQEYVGITGFIPVKSGNVVRFNDDSGKLYWNTDGAADAYCNIVYYDESFVFVGGITQKAVYYGACVASDVPTGSLATGDIVSFTVPTNSSIAYVRIGVSTASVDGSNMNSITVTVNEEIKEGTKETLAWTNTGKTTAFTGAEEVLILTESELRTLTQEKLATAYTNGARIIGVTEDYENLVPKAISESGAIYNGCGYMRGYRLNSSGGMTADETGVTTGFIPYTYGKDILIVGGLRTNDYGGQYVATYGESFELIQVYYLSSIVSNSGGVSVFNDKNIREDVIKGSYMTDKNVKYIRVSLLPCIGKDMRVSYS